MRLVLLDRDGVLNEDRPESVRRPEELVMLPGAAAAVARLNRAGLKVALVTNQSIVGRGQVARAAIDQVHAKLAEALAKDGAMLDAVLVCTDAPDRATIRRKPAPGMLVEAMARFGAGPRDTVMVGDHARDIEAARAAGCAAMLVRTGRGAEAAHRMAADTPVFDDLGKAVDAILAARRR